VIGRGTVGPASFDNAWYDQGGGPSEAVSIRHDRDVPLPLPPHPLGLPEDVSRQRRRGAGFAAPESGVSDGLLVAEPHRSQGGDR